MEDAVEESAMLPIVSALTFTVHFAVTPLPSAAVHVIVAVPAPTAVNNPSEETVATPVLPDFHVTFLFVALSGETNALK